jgi:hypothetical protein
LNRGGVAAGVSVCVNVDESSSSALSSVVYYGPYA